MPRSPSIAPALPDDIDVYLVLDDFGERLGRAWRETKGPTNRETVVTDLIDGQNSDWRGWSPSTPRKAGRATSPGSSPTRSSGGAPGMASTCRRFWRVLSIGMAAGDRRSCPCR
jgi:hypothetical protein